MRSEKMENIGVIFGGRSVEHEVSVITGMQIIENMDKTKYNPIPIYITKSGKFLSGESLKNFWKEEYNNTFDSGEVILNLASNEFSRLLDRSKFKIYEFEFFEKKDKKLKSHSTISKKSRGKMLNYICKNKVTDYEKIKFFNLDEFKFDEDLSEEEKFVFIK